MNMMVRNLVVGGSIFVFFWVGCSDDEETLDEDGTVVASSTGPTSTGTMGATGTTISTTAPASSSSTGGGMKYACNPVTNEPCEADQACDLTNMGTMGCIAPPNEGAICDTCDQMNGPWCQGTMTCLGGDSICRRYCCDDGDCGPNLTCDKTILAGDGFTEIGICSGTISAGGAGGMGGAGGASSIPGCSDVPPVAPSNGSCVPFP